VRQLAAAFINKGASLASCARALAHPIEDNAAKEKIQAAQEHVKQLLFSVYPAPDDYEPEKLVAQQKEKIRQYQEETRSKYSIGDITPISLRCVCQKFLNPLHIVEK
jgi:hypothetical protein